MLQRLVWIGLATLALRSVAVAVSPNTCSTPFGNICLVFVPQATDQATAEQACQTQFGGHLASIHSQAEDALISTLLPSNAGCNPNTGVGCNTAWIGAVGGTNGFCGANATPGWTDNTPWDFSNWRTGEPNCSGGTGCVQFWPNSGPASGWNDVACNVALGGFVCEFTVPPAPAPALSGGSLEALAIGLIAAGWLRLYRSRRTHAAR